MLPMPASFWNWLPDEKPAASLTPLGVMAQWYGQMDRLMENTLRSMGMPMGSATASMFRPSMDISAQENHYVINVELPGMDEEGIHVEPRDNGTIVIRGEKRQERTSTANDTHLAECSYGRFMRVLTLPQDAGRGAFETKFKNGVLTLTIPRKAMHAPQASNTNRAEPNKGASPTKAA